MVKQGYFEMTAVTDTDSSWTKQLHQDIQSVRDEENTGKKKKKKVVHKPEYFKYQTPEFKDFPK